MASERLYRVIAGFVLERRLKKPLNEPVSLGLGYFGAGDEIEVDFKLKLPLVGIGAPTGVMLPYAAKKLGAECVLPEDFGVANAVGAITGSVVVRRVGHHRLHRPFLRGPDGVRGRGAGRDLGQRGGPEDRGAKGQGHGRGQL